MRSVFLFITAIIFTFVACTSNENKENKDTSQSEAMHHQHEEVDDPDDTFENMELDNGERWVVNEEMKPYLSASETLVTGYLGQASEDNRQLATDLKTQYKELIKSCTMTGKSHDELHKWLYPYINLVEKLNETTSKAEADELVAHINESFDVYHQFFQ